VQLSDIRELHCLQIGGADIKADRPLFAEKHT
jgi:hypothetical protein